MAGQEQEKAKILTLDIKPRSREAIKPAELIQVSGHHELTLNARRAITILWYNAHLQGVAENRDYTIEIDDLKPDGHKGYEMVGGGGCRINADDPYLAFARWENAPGTVPWRQ